MTSRRRTPGCQYPRICVYPSYPIETHRLRLRPLTVDDTDSLVSYRSREDVRRFVPFTPMDHDVITERLSGVWSRKDIVSRKLIR